MNTPILVTISSFLFAMGLGRVTYADLIDSKVRGVVETLASVGGADVKLGDSFVVTFTLDSNAIDDFDNIPTWGRYQQAPTSGITVTAGNATYFASQNAGLGLNFYAEVHPGHSGYMILQAGSGTVGQPRIQILLTAPRFGGFATDGIPITSIDTTQFVGATMFITGNFGDPLEVAGPFSSLTAVPEPSSLFLLSAVGGLIAIRCRRQCSRELVTF